MPLRKLPTLNNVRGLPRYLERRIPETFLDQNGHMNIRHYVALFDEAGFAFFESLGIDPSYFSERKLGIFDLEHHLSYLAECHMDDEVSVYGRLVARNAKRVHGVWFLVNDTREQLSCVFEFVSSHADLAARKTAPFPSDVGEQFDRQVAEHQDLSWPPPVCGIMGV